MADEAKPVVVGDGSVVDLRLVNMGDGTFAERVNAQLGAAGFDAGKEFRTFYEMTILQGASAYFKVSTPIDLVLQGIGMQVDDGYVSFEAYVNVTSPTGFVTSLPIIAANRMSTRPTPLYASQVTFTTGGTFTGGIRTDLLRIKTANNSNSSATQDASVPGFRGLGTGDYYLKMNNLGSGSALAIMKARWEERP